MDLDGRIAELLRNRPGLRAKEVAAALNEAADAVQAALNAGRGVRFAQDNGYRWRIAGESGASNAAPRTLLARLCGYYIDCLTHDQLDVAALIDSRDWAELAQLPLDGSDPFEQPQVREMLRGLRADRHGGVLLLGYPVRLFRHPRGDGGFTAVPVCLWTYVDQRNGPPRIESGAPAFNLAFFRGLGRDAGDGMDDAIQTGDELGLYEKDIELPEPAEFFARLRAVRPDWDWRDEPGESMISEGPPLASVAAEGIYHRAMLLTGARSPYTAGLEQELRKLAPMAESKYAHTALGHWLEDRRDAAPAADPKPLIEVMPLNAEQREATRRALESRLTVITGPPGTGKSQVVSAILINAAWRGLKVLFASKNHQAVDVVEERCNALGPRAALLRLGSNEHLAVLCSHVDSLLGSNASRDDQARLDESLAIQTAIERRGIEISDAWRGLVERRNRADALEQEAESARALFGEQRFRSLRGWRPEVDAPAVERLAQALARAIPSGGRGGPMRDLEQAAAGIREVAERLGAELPTGDPSQLGLATWEPAVSGLIGRYREAVRATEYFRALEELDASREPAALAGAESELAGELTANSRAIWNAWLRLQPGRLTPEHRRGLGRYAALLRLMLAGGPSRKRIETPVFREYYQVFPLVADAIHCWAVTSLSARMAPFDPAVFDIVVIDEASQCDIASALPLLYRAKSAVVIGDAQQLRHISGITGRLDGQLLSRHGLSGGRENWSFAANSLFDLAMSICDGASVVNLRDHFRSHADIIGLSNDQFYRGGLRIATPYDRLRQPGGPAVQWIDVRGRARRPGAGGASNEEEARAIVAEVKRLVLDHGYRGSIGVASPFRAQANRIRELLTHDEALAGAIDKHQILADTVHGFQGGERDVMFFSPVVSAGMTESGLRFLKNNGYLFNVAITRARAALITVGDWTAAQGCGVEYLARLARHASTLAEVPPPPLDPADLGPDYPPVAKSSLVSRWEHVLYRALFAAGVRPVPQYAVEHYLLDFAVFADGRQLNIEVDGEAYHRRWDGESCRRDVIRTQRLTGLGWEVKRFWVYQVRDDVQGCVDWVVSWIREGS